MKRTAVLAMFAAAMFTGSASANQNVTDLFGPMLKEKAARAFGMDVTEVRPTEAANTRKDCTALTGYGAPVYKRAAPKDEFHLVCRAGYLLQHSVTTKGAVWVAEYLQPHAIYGDEPRTNDFKPDPAVPTRGRATLGDYKGSGYDRGHYAPAADFSQDAGQMADSFFLSNMGPQEPSMNRGVWAEIEKFARKRASRSSKGLFIVTGPVFAMNGGRYVATKTASACPSKFKEPNCEKTFEKTYATVGRKEVFVPDAWFKVILDPSTGTTWAFVVPNMEMPKERNMRIDPWLHSVKEVEDKTGLTFFPGIPAASRAFQLHRVSVHLPPSLLWAILASKQPG